MRSNKFIGFTLVEILVVVGIVGLLTTLGVATYTQITKQARDSRRTGDIHDIKQAIEMYKSQEGVYPTPCPTDAATCPGGLPFGNGALRGSNNNTYLGSLPQDPKGATYRYYSIAPYQTYRLCADLESGTTYALDPYGENSCDASALVAFTPPTAAPTIPMGGPTVGPTIPPGATPTPAGCGRKEIGPIITLGQICM